MKMPDDVFEIRSREKLPHISWTTSKNAAGTEYYAGHYKKIEKMVTEKFKFHYSIAQKLSQEELLPFEVTCFSDDTSNYIVYASKSTDNFYFTEEINNIEFKNLLRIYFQIFNLFQKVESYGAVFFEFHNTQLLISQDKKIKLHPWLMLNICQEGKLCHVPQNNWYILEEEKLGKKFDRTGDCVISKVSRNLNLYHFVEAMSNYGEKYPIERMKSKYRIRMNSLRYRMRTLEHIISTSKDFDYSWKKLQAFLSSWAQDGDLAYFVAEVEHKQAEYMRYVQYQYDFPKNRRFKIDFKTLIASS